ncbi:MAG TPA: SDR family oxidoreductase, partial [Pyrinomonadaceae bacterium]|nr:SDR family oxidoreductase [Pyrinomonadaceae bacterium]
DLTDENQVKGLFKDVESRVGPIDAVAFIAAARVQAPFAELGAEDFERVWRQSCFSGFLVGREAARCMLLRGCGTVIFTGASGSMRGKPRFAQFAAAKSGLRMIAQSMAREFGPQGIHVAHVVIDGGVGGDRLLNAFPAAAQMFGEDGMLDPEAIAESYWQIHRQPRSAWSHEIDLRTFKETF